MTLEKATKSFGSNVVLNKVDLTVQRGELIVILGENGAGKTTLLRVIAGLLGLDQGELRIEEEGLNRFSEEQREKIFFLPDFPTFFEDLTIMENIEIWLSLYHQEGMARESLAVDLLDRFGLMEKTHQPVSTLSRGQRFKLAMTCYQSVDAQIGLFDEPFASGIDATGLREMKKVIRDAVDADRSVLYSTQLVSYALNFSDRVLVISDGHIYFDGSPEKFSNQLQGGDQILGQFSEE